VRNTGGVGDIYAKFDGFNSLWGVVSDSDGDFSSGATYLGDLDASGSIQLALGDGEYFTLVKRFNPGFTISPNSLSITENGGTGIASLVLTEAPASDVVLQISSSNTAEFTVSPATLTFTPSNWNTPQDVTLTGVNDNDYL